MLRKQKKTKKPKTLVKENYSKKAHPKALSFIGEFF